MNKDTMHEVYRQHRQAQEKYAYFLLAAAGAAIALAVNQTRDRMLTFSQMPLAAAVALWSLSFVLGCRYLNFSSLILFANLDLLRVEDGMHPDVGGHPELMAAASTGIRQAVEHNNQKAAQFARWQFRCLVVGAGFYVAWHVFEMYQRRPS